MTLPAASKLSRLVMLAPLLLVFACSEHSPSPSAGTVDSVIVPRLPRPAPAAAWAGRWSREEWANGAGLEISAVSDRQMHIRLQAVNGGHTGELDETIARDGNNAAYTLRDEYDDCLIKFRLLGDSVIEVDQVRGDCGAAMGVTFSGRYQRNDADAPSKPEETLLSLGIFANASQDAAFRALTGDTYASFLSNTQLTADDTDLDGLDAIVKSSAVRGLYTIMEQIVMIDAGNQIWAATIDDDTVRYFTNSGRFTHELPRTIEAWRERFRDKPVVTVVKVGSP